MAYRFFSVSAVVVAIAVIAGVESAGQAPSAARPASKSTWTQARTPDGQPDLQGVWTNATFTPLERPAEFAGKAFWTPEEAAAYEKRRVDAFLGQPADNIHYDDAIWQTETYKKGVSGLRTSLITDPPDGRIPPLTPEARKRAADRAARRRGNPYDAAETASNLERCITWGADVPPLLPAVYYSNLQIVQGAGYVVVMTETIHSARIIPLDGRPHLGPKLRPWTGDSRGHWEGNTLVVDTTNYNDKTVRNGASENLHVTERFTRVDADTIRYEFTVDDPTTWTRPWSAEIPIKRMQGPLFEYACTEGNYGLANILRAARVEDAKAHEAAAKASSN